MVEETVDEFLRKVLALSFGCCRNCIMYAINKSKQRGLMIVFLVVKLTVL